MHNVLFGIFSDIVKASHLKPLEKTEKIVDPNLSQKNVIWNSAAKKNYEKSSPYNEWKKNKKHFRFWFDFRFLKIPHG